MVISKNESNNVPRSGKDMQNISKPTHISYRQVVQNPVTNNYDTESEL